MTPLMMTAAGMVGLVMLIHVYFALLETVLFRSRGVKVFRLTPEKADMMAPIMSNQGVYNLFLVAALAIGLFWPAPDVAQAFVLFGLSCVIVAGVWGAATVMRTIFFVQALPAIVALGLYAAAHGLLGGLTASGAT